MKWLLLLAVFCLPLAAAHADESTPLSYSKSRLAIVRKNPPPAAQMPWQTQPTPQDPAIIFDVEIRDAAMLYNQQGWYDLSGLSQGSGVLFAFGAPASAPIKSRTQYTPLDILFIDEEGKILQILPSIVLSDLEKEIRPAQPVLAFLFLRGGSCAALGIAPGDEIEYKLFKKPPPMLGVTPPPAAPAQPVAPAPAPAPAEPKQSPIP